MEQYWKHNSFARELLKTGLSSLENLCEESNSYHSNSKPGSNYYFKRSMNTASTGYLFQISLTRCSGHTYILLEETYFSPEHFAQILTDVHGAFINLSRV